MPMEWAPSLPQEMEKVLDPNLHAVDAAQFVAPDHHRHVDGVGRH